MTTKPPTDFPTGQGFTEADWNEVSDNPERTEADIKQAVPFAEAFPALAA